MRCVTVLGATGSIGRQTLDVIRSRRGEFKVSALAAHRNVALLCEQIREFRPRRAVVADAEAAATVREQLGADCPELDYGPAALASLAGSDDADVVVGAVVGAAGIKASLAAVRAGKRLALANKEALVAAGSIITAEAARTGAEIIPVDSEHSAIFQCLQSGRRDEVERIWLTASGGPFRGWDVKRLAGVTPEEAVRHPRWQMGPKISVDSATMMNKAFEIIEAYWLFGVRYDQVEVVIHPQSTVHSMVEFRDGSFVAHLGATDMRIPISYALHYPERGPSTVPPMRPEEWKLLEFEPPSAMARRALDLAYGAGRSGGTMPAALNAANEEAVALFLQGKIPFTAILDLCEQAVERHRSVSRPSLEDVLAADEWARDAVRRQVVS